MALQAYNLVLGGIASFDGSLQQLGNLIKDLDAMWTSCVDWSEEERREFRSDWGLLEQIYAEALDKESAKLSSQDILDSRATLKKIKSSLEAKALNERT
ncbi:MAG TPA: hypothetical protein VGU65_07060 [Frateuria sp.]|uniref:hypothetical protein n=1 Tax=Frateuria sp. TaxID=2211372 RepID=UPI002DE6E5CB|nr:hypothetical protein [Frateuria sp.]